MVKTDNERTPTGLPLGLGLMLAAVMLAVGCARTMPDQVGVSPESVVSLKQEFVLSDGTSVVIEKPVPEPTGFATLRGRFVLSGGSPGVLRVIRADKDLDICAANGNIPNEALVIGSGNGIQNVLVYVETKAFKIPIGDPKWEHQEYLDRMNAVLEGEEGFDQEKCYFSSHVFAMRATQTLQIQNSDSIGHNTDLQAASGRANRVNYQVPGRGFVLYEPGYKSKGPFRVSCGAHSWMGAYMHVVDHPFFAVSDAEGKFEIKHVPSGVELEFRIWHESAQKLGSVTLNNTPATLTKSRLKGTFTDGEVVDWNIEIDVSNFEHLFN
jgi:hypothetical protein